MLSDIFAGAVREAILSTVGIGQKIRVIGVGSGGNNAVNHMIDEGVKGVDFIAVNTKSQVLSKSQAFKMQIGERVTNGLGAGMKPSVGEQAAQESREVLIEVLKGAEMVFVTAGMGGGTGTGASPVVAQCARDAGALTITVVTKPFTFEGKIRAKNAQEGIERLKESADAIIVVPFDTLMGIMDKDTNAIKFANDILRQAIQGISDLITAPGSIDLDLADLRTILSGQGEAVMGIGTGSGDNRASDAATMAINSPLLGRGLSGAKSIIIHIARKEDLGFAGIGEATQIITDAADPDANIIFGTSVDETLDDDTMKVTIIATGFGDK